MLSPAVASGGTPSSSIGVPAAPPMADVLTVTLTAVLAGFVPGVTAALKTVLSPGATVSGAAALQATSIGVLQVTSSWNAPVVSVVLNGVTSTRYASPSTLVKVTLERRPLSAHAA